MNGDLALDICRRAVEAGLLAMMPILLAALFAGLLAGIFQAATQLQEPTLAFVPKLLALAAALILFGGFSAERLRLFTVEVYTLLGGLSR